jgi:hypothetical protein
MVIDEPTQTTLALVQEDPIPALTIMRLCTPAWLFLSNAAPPRPAERIAIGGPIRGYVLTLPDL